MKKKVTELIDDLKTQLEGTAVTHELDELYYGTISLVISRGKIQYIKREETVKCRQQ